VRGVKGGGERRYGDGKFIDVWKKVFFSVNKYIAEVVSVLV
jgi:hypothetical protein